MQGPAEALHGRVWKALMRAALLIAALLLVTAGCDDSAVHDRIDSVLDHGVVQGRATCVVNDPTNCGGFSFTQTVDFAKLQDDSVLLSIPSGGQLRLDSFCSRSEACANPPTWVTSQSGETIEYRADSGFLQVVGAGSNVSFYCGSSPFVFFSDEIGDACTGFNLEAFD